MKRLNVIFYGTVQGVGFRYTARHLASDLGLMGWVKNLPGGEVEAVVEGDENKIYSFLSQINRYFENHINKKDLEWSDATGDFDHFGIWY